MITPKAKLHLDHLTVKGILFTSSQFQSCCLEFFQATKTPATIIVEQDDLLFAPDYFIKCILPEEILYSELLLCSRTFKRACHFLTLT